MFHSERPSIGYVVSIEGRTVTLNLKDEHKGQVASHPQGVSPVTEVGSLFAVDGGTNLIILKVLSLYFAEPKEIFNHNKKVASIPLPLRHLEAITLGVLTRDNKGLHFTSDSLFCPPLGGEAYPLTSQELMAIVSTTSSENTKEHLILGTPIGGGMPVKVDTSDFLGRHVAVLGSTGQGKSCFTAAILQQLAKAPNARIVIFDINGEYDGIFNGHIADNLIKRTKLGDGSPEGKIPYVALGRHGLGRLLLPSEKTQRPAMNFALDNLNKVQWHSANQGCSVDGTNPVLFDDCRSTDARPAFNAISTLREGRGTIKTRWPHFRALSSLIAESHSIKIQNNNYVRDAFLYSNVNPLVARINNLLIDEQFCSVVDVEERDPVRTGGLDWKTEGEAIVKKFFGNTDVDWRIHIVNASLVAHDLMPLTLGSLLELLAFDTFRRGPNNTYPILLVLEEAHHYLRQLPDSEDTGKNSLAYERLAKEGRKFGIALWLSTQRPSEVSPTVLSQCGTWVTFKLTGEADLRSVSSATEWADKQEISRISGLARRQAIIFGSGVSLPTRIIAHEAKPTPMSSDPNFSKWFLADEVDLLS